MMDHFLQMESQFVVTVGVAGISPRTRTGIKGKSIHEMEMDRRNLLFQSFRMAFVMGSVLALYISITTFGQMPHGLWLAINNLLVGISLILAAFIGYKNRVFEVSLYRHVLLVIMLLYVSSYSELVILIRRWLFSSFDGPWYASAMEAAQQLLRKSARQTTRYS